MMHRKSNIDAFPLEKFGRLIKAHLNLMLTTCSFMAMVPKELPVASPTRPGSDMASQSTDRPVLYWLATQIITGSEKSLPQLSQTVLSSSRSRSF